MDVERRTNRFVKIVAVLMMPLEMTLFRNALFAVTLTLAQAAIAQEAMPAANAMTPEQITAFNQAVVDFTAAQTAQQAGDNAGALTKYEAALPAIRAAVWAQPGNVANVSFLANALYAAAAASGNLGKSDAMLSLFAESAPHWRTVLAIKPNDDVSRGILASVLIQLANAKLVKQDKAGAEPLYAEAIKLARALVAAKPADAPARNILLSALIGNSQASVDPKAKEEAVAMARTMLAQGSVDAINKPNAQILAGSPATK